jgi:hypothetical protein
MARGLIAGGEIVILEGEVWPCSDPSISGEQIRGLDNVV